MLQKVTRRRPGESESAGTKKFHLNEILSVAADLPLAQEGSAAIHRLVAYMTETEASSLNTTMNAEVVKDCLEEQLPFLKEINLSGLHQIFQYSAENAEPNPYLAVWLEMQALRYGAEHALMPIMRWDKQKAYGEAVAP